ncbi:MAG: radical SAM protein [Thermoplasmata archaeon]
MNFKEDPVVVFLEVTRACLLACRHCRANANPKRNPLELSIKEFKEIGEKMGKFNNRPLIIITGGDPLMREDIFEIIDIFKEMDFSIAISFSGTALATEERLNEISKNVKTVAISLDGSNENVHDGFRNVKGTFETSMKIIKYLKGKVNVQINTTLSKYNYNDFRNILNIIKNESIKSWDIFYIVPTGRANEDLLLDKYDVYQSLEFLYSTQINEKIRIKTTEAPFYNRFKMERNQHVVVDENGYGVTDGRGTLFISHIGEIYPTGFIPIVAGNVRKDDLVNIYRKSKIFNELREPGLLKGKCSKCMFKNVCGGSRSRAYAHTGDYLQEDPLCPFEV